MTWLLSNFQHCASVSKSTLHNQFVTLSIDKSVSSQPENVSGENPLPVMTL